MDEIKVRATGWPGIGAAVAGIIVLTFVVGMVAASVAGRGSSLTGAATLLTFTVSAVGYFGFVLPRWLDESWQRCPWCRKPIAGAAPGLNFCDQCGGVVYPPEVVEILRKA